MSSSTAKILRRPARKIACESATITRINCSLFSISGGATRGSPVPNAALAILCSVDRTLLPDHFQSGALGALETVFVNHHGHAASSVFSIAADHAPVAFHFHVLARADNFGGKRDGEIDNRAHWHINVVMKQDAIGRNVVAFRVALTRL